MKLLITTMLALALATAQTLAPACPGFSVVVAEPSISDPTQVIYRLRCLEPITIHWDNTSNPWHSPTPTFTLAGVPPFTLTYTDENPVPTANPEVFTITKVPNALSFILTKNGVKMRHGIDYALAGRSITWLVPPPFGTDTVVAHYSNWFPVN